MKDFLLRLNQRISRMTSRVKIDKGSSNSPSPKNKSIRQIRVKNNGGSVVTEYFSLCGFLSPANDDSLGIILNLSSRTDDTVAFLFSPTEKFNENDTVIFNPKHPESNIVIHSDGTITINSDSKIEINSTGDINIKSENGIINLGEGGNEIARKGDQIQVTTGSGTYIGQIIQGGQNKST